MLIRRVPNETANAGANRDSVGCVRDARKVYGYSQKRAKIVAQIPRNKAVLIRKKIVPIVLRPGNRYGTVFVSNFNVLDNVSYQHGVH